MAKVGGDGAEAFKTIVFDVVSEVAKRMIWPG